MAGSSILLILTCAVILIQGTPWSNINSNLNSNILHRRGKNTNINANTNRLGWKLPRYLRYIVDDDLLDSTSALSELRRELFVRGNELVAAAAMAAAQETKLITKAFAEKMSDSSAIAVASAVGNLLIDPDQIQPRGFLNRRNNNYNVNTNTNIVGRDSSYLAPFDDTKYYQQKPYPSSGMPGNRLTSFLRPKSASGFNDDATPLDYASDVNGILNDDVENDEDKTIFDDDVEVDENVEHEDDDDAPTTTVESLTLDQTNRRNSNMNLNKNRLETHRRNNNSNLLKMNAFRRNVNSNSNSNVNSYRRSSANFNAKRQPNSTRPSPSSGLKKK